MSASGFLAVGMGAAIGAWLRWLLGLALNSLLPALPLGTLAANLAGGFLIGMAVEFFGTRAGLPPEWRLFVVTGFLGGLTTFSTFSAEAVNLLGRDDFVWAGAHVAAHLVGSLVLTFAGIHAMRVLQAG
jgi:CrcB protein